MRTTKTTCALDQCDHLLPSFILPRIKAKPDQAVHAWQEDQIRGSPCMTGEPKLSRPCCCTLWGNYGLIIGGWLPKAAACFAFVQKRGELCWQHIICTTVSTSSSKWERGCVRNYLRELRSDLAGLPAFCERIRIIRFRCLDPEPNNEF